MPEGRSILLLGATGLIRFLYLLSRLLASSLRAEDSVWTSVVRMRHQ